MLDLLRNPWPWYLSGPAIAIIMVLLLLFGKSFGFSSNLRTLCTIAGAGKYSAFFNFDWKSQKWNLFFLLGAILGGIIAGTLLRSEEPMALSPQTIADLSKIDIHFDGALNPHQLFSMESLGDVKNIMILLIGGLLVGFGARYAGGCTSGHAISGLSNLQLPSLIAVIGFFIGGLIMTHFLLPIILK